MTDLWEAVVRSELGRIRGVAIACNDRESLDRINAAAVKIEGDFDRLADETEQKPRLLLRSRICRELAAVCRDEETQKDFTALATRYEYLARRLRAPPKADDEIDANGG
jgi:hypothetical protein